MHSWRSLFEILRFTLVIIFIGCLCLTIGNLIVSPVYGLKALAQVGDNAVKIGEFFRYLGRFILVNFPFLFMLKLVGRSNDNGVTILASIVGYVCILLMTVFFGSQNMDSEFYSSILGINVSVTSIKEGIAYPYQMGLIASLIEVGIVILVFRHKKSKLWKIISDNTTCMVRVIVYSLLCGLVLSYVWPIIISAFEKNLNFLAKDITNPINLVMYGVLEKICNVLGLGNLIHTPFWFEKFGGEWMNSVGTIFLGDVNIWSAQIGSNVTSMAGRFITPYYILNIFIIPWFVWGIFSLYSDRKEKFYKAFLYGVIVFVSVFGGCSLPVELFMLIVAPLFFVFHLFMSSFLYGVLMVLNCFVGFNTTETLTLSAQPGTLGELLTYISGGSNSRGIAILIIVGIVYGLIYYFATKLYFRKLSTNLFGTNNDEKISNLAIKAMGGEENIKRINTNPISLTIDIYDNSLVDISLLDDLGLYRIYETKQGYRLCLGGCSYMVGNKIREIVHSKMRASEL